MLDQPDDSVSLDLLPELEPCFSALLARHKEAAEKGAWSYHDYLPLDALRANAADHPPLSPAAYVAVETALLTEVNLPWYTAGLAHGLESCPAPIQEFVRVWTAEEDQHASLLEGYLLLTGSGDHGSRSRLRKAIITTGWRYGRHGLSLPIEGMVYTAMQEAATRTFYLCAARAFEEEHPALSTALRRIARDETLHMAFYRDVVKAHLDVDADYVLPLSGVMLRFEMPWSGAVQRDFEERRSYLAMRGIFRLSDYFEDVVQPLWSYWGLDTCEPRRETARAALVQLRRYRTALRKLARNEAAALEAQV